MRPHTRTRCQDGNQCPECRDTPGANSSHSSSGGGAEGPSSSTSNAASGDPFVAPTSTATRRSSAPVPSTSKTGHQGNALATVKSSEVMNNTSGVVKRAVLLVELPAELLVKILNYLSFNEISHVRLVRSLNPRSPLLQHCHTFLLPFSGFPTLQ